MISVRTLLPRLVLAGLTVMLMLVAANPLLKLGIVRTAESITGTRFTIERARSSLSEGYLALHGCVAAHPMRPLHNLFEADSMVFDFDREALSDRRFVVHRATIDGLRLGTRRSTSGFLDETQPSRYLAELTDEFAQSGQVWLNRTNRQLEQEAELQFELSTSATEMANRWSVEMSELELAASAVALRVSALQAQLDGAGDNPLRNIASYLVAIAEAEQLSRDMHDIRGQISRLEQQILLDRETIVSSRNGDLQRIERSLDVLGLNSEELSAYLLGPEVSSWIGEAISWVQWGRHFLPSLGDRSQGEGGRGELIWFRDLCPRATVEIENLVLRGTIPHGGEEISLEGRVVGLTSHPDLSAGMTELIVQTTSETPLLVQASLSHTGEQDEILLNLPSHPRPPRTLGNERQFAIDMDSSSTHVWMQIKIDEDALSGQLIMKERPTGMRTVTRQRRHGEQLTQLIDNALEKVDRIDMEVNLSGTLDHPAWTINSNLGPQLAVSMRAAVERQLLERRRRRLAAVSDEADARLATLSDDLAALKSNVLDQLETDAHAIAEVKHTIARRVEASDGLVDPASPLREVFRR